MALRPRFHLLLALAFSVLAAVAPAAAAREHRHTHARIAQPCSSPDAPTRDARRLERALLCLHNSARRSRGLGAVRPNRVLTTVASRYARSMVAWRFFDHDDLNGHDHMDRVAASAYRPASGCWTAGENLIVSDGVPTPRLLMDSWLRSAGHRANVLYRRWRDVGFGVAAGSPSGAAGGLTVVALYGVRGPC